MTAPVSSDVHPLHIATFPLHGSRLIEASAGTGKTYTIAMLYVRLVLGPRHASDPHSFTRALTPPEILVVTFTEAATQELRERIRRRLAQAALVFRAPENADAPVEWQGLLELRNDYPPDHWPTLARRLEVAADWMDEAAISTIHGWCYRMLREHAFASHSLFTQTLETDDSELLTEAVRDYWRIHIAPLALPLAQEVNHWWGGPAALEDEALALLPYRPHLPVPTHPVVADLLNHHLQARAQRLQELKVPWNRWLPDIKALLDQAVEQGHVDRKKLRAQYYDPWLKKLQNWVDDPHSLQPADLGTGWTRLTPDGLAAVWHPNHTYPDHPAWAALQALPAALGNLCEARIHVLHHAVHWIEQRHAQFQARRAQMGFNDLLTRLDAALQGPHGQALADTVRLQFPVAMIDEFQDTDPTQYRIFDAIYRVADTPAHLALVMIGDPKQAIYAFRGADIHTYLRARRDCGSRLYTLGTNHRSTQGMVMAVNHCFAQAEHRPNGQGAFLFRGPAGNPVPFLPAQAAGRDQRWTQQGQASPALNIWCLPPNDDGKPASKDQWQQQLAHICATEMVRLLNDSAQGQCGVTATSSPTIAPLQPKDMAVLVNHRGEAQAIRTALAERGVRSVYLSDRESVYNTAQAREVQHWLAACSSPENPRLLRAALATPTLGLNWHELEQLNHDEMAWEAMVLRFRHYRECWQRRGVLPMVRLLLNDFHVPARLLAPQQAQTGERTLTDILHLAELLQTASLQLDGEHALMRYLAEQREWAAQGRGGEAPQLRLESDADLVQVITVHKSKGLEYPLVFYPFAYHWRGVKSQDTPLTWHDAEGQVTVATGGSDEEREQWAHLADQDRLGEDLRKLYVALTRARYATWIGIAPLEGLHESALGYLIHGTEPLEPSALSARLQQWAQDCPHIQVHTTATSNPTPWQTLRDEAADYRARTSRQVAPPRWWIASYSALRTQDQWDTSPAADSPQQDQLAEPAPLVPEALQASQTPPEPGTLHAFVRGREAGTLWHDLLQWCVEQGVAEVCAQPERLRQQVAKRCEARQWPEWVEPLTQGLLDLLQHPLPLPASDGPPHCTLLQATALQAEMEFWLSVQHTPTALVDQWVTQHTLGGAPRPPLAHDRLNGMLKGFIDLVMEHEGRYYVIDYKSNWLGPSDPHYTLQAMRDEVLRSRYELQYVLYLLALHRLLRLKLPGYDYDQHMGGALYIFLRGLHGPAQGVHSERPPRELIEALDTLFTHGSPHAHRP